MEEQLKEQQLVIDLLQSTNRLLEFRVKSLTTTNDELKKQLEEAQEKLAVKEKINDKK